MYPANPLLMIAFVAVTYLANYGAGAVLLQLAHLRLGSVIERFGLSCAVGSVVLSWLGYAAMVGRLPWLPGLAGWLGVAAAIAVMVRARRQTAEGEEPLPRGDTWILLLAVAVGLGFAAAMNYWQVRYLPDGSIIGRAIWPDQLYRNAVMMRVMNCTGAPEWPWLAGLAMKGMSLLRFTALMVPLKMLGISASYYYQSASMWVGLYGVPVAVCTLFAFFRAVGANVRVSSTAVLLTSFLGNPRWLFAERFAHSPALHWAGADVFAISVPVLFATITVIALAVNTRRTPTLILGGFMLASALGHEPWIALPLYPALGLWALVALWRRQEVRTALVLAAGALCGLVVLRLLMGTGANHNSPLAALGPSPTIRSMNWAFPFLAEQLQLLVASGSPMALLKFFKFACVFPVAVLFYLAGSLWLRNLIWLQACRCRREWWQSPLGALGGCLIISAVLVTSVIDFNKLAYQGAQYDVLRVLWFPLLLANLALAVLAVDYRGWLKTRWGVIFAILFVFYGSWENVQIVQWSRLSLPWTKIEAPQAAALRYMATQVQPNDVVLLNPRYDSQTPRTDAMLPASHHWGYASGLLDARFYLDNEDMARKFGQGEMFDYVMRGRFDYNTGRLNPTENPTLDARLASLLWVRQQRDPHIWSRFLAVNKIRWIILEPGDELRINPAQIGLTQGFERDGVRVYRFGG